jgi:peptidyl-prolyl cis-trans isomerase SurA
MLEHDGPKQDELMVGFRFFIRVAAGARAAAFAKTAVLAAMLVLTAGPALAQKVVVLVNGRPITDYDIAMRSKLTQISTHKTPTRQETIDDLINDKVKIAEGARYSITASDADVDRAVTGMAQRTGMNLQQFGQALAGSGVNIQTLKDRVRAELVWSQLVRGRFPSAYQVDDSEVHDALVAKNEAGEVSGFDYRLRPIVFVVPRGSPPAAYQARVREAEALRSRFDGCNSGIKATRGLHDVAVRSIVTKTSADLAPDTRKILDSIELGKLSKPEITQQGVEVFALCEKRPTKVDTPQKKDLHDAILNKRVERQSSAYLQRIRKEAMIDYKK